MNIARFRISGEGDSEKGWKRLFGWMSERSGEGAGAKPVCDRESHGLCLRCDGDESCGIKCVDDIRDRSAGLSHRPRSRTKS